MSTASSGDQLRRVTAENVIMFSLSQALIATHPDPRTLLALFESLHNEVMAGPLFDARTDERLLALIADEHRSMRERIEHVIRTRPAG